LQILGFNKSREDGCRYLLILKEQVRLLCGVLWVLIFFNLIGDRDLTTSEEVDCGVLLLLTRSFEGYSSSWDFLIRNKENFEIGLGNSRKEADAMPSDLRRLDF
jgi:hypothetical protein